MRSLLALCLLAASAAPAAAEARWGAELYGGSAYNVLVSHAYQPDVFFDYEPHLEYLPNPYEGFRAYLPAMLQY